MTAKCVHKGCGKTFSDPEEECVYHPGPPVFHEGQKGWQCCKPRFLTFDEFLAIPPCTVGKHSTVDDTPQPEVKPPSEEIKPSQETPADGASQVSNAAPPRLPQAAAAQARVPAPVAAPESDSDDPAATIPEGVTCKRRGCGVSSSQAKGDQPQKCIYHPGQAVFHEGSKGWSCCKRRVLEFDEFMKIAGCKTRERHCFVGKNKAKSGPNGSDQGHYEKLATVRHDFYQTGSTIHASMYLKKIDKDKSSVDFPDTGNEIQLDLKTQDGKQYAATVHLFGKIDASKSTFKILGTKLDLTLAKTDGSGWPVLRSDEQHTGEIIQTGRAGRA